MKTNDSQKMNLQFSEVKLVYKNKIPANQRASVKYSQQAFNILKDIFSDFMEHHEEFWVLLLNNRNQLIGISQIGKGGVNSTPVDTKILLQSVILSNATGFIIAHNHPSGNLNLSNEDEIITQKIKTLSNELDSKLLDHVILSPEGYLSMSDEGLL